MNENKIFFIEIDLAIMLISFFLSVYFGIYAIIFCLLCSIKSVSGIILFILLIKNKHFQSNKNKFLCFIPSILISVFIIYISVRGYMGNNYIGLGMPMAIGLPFWVFYWFYQIEKKLLRNIFVIITPISFCTEFILLGAHVSGL
ncbi:MAG: hypothetical protein Ta2A_08790 [Treponemataceae bacterium]|nr:MAG: hypothetical protein Ta2A_08790 [Treponemataceae bacterium]